MLILALRCIVQDHRHRNLHHIVRKPSMELARQQRHDGSFGDLRNTVLVMQALEEVENEPADNWNRSAALAWLINQQRSDGSFHGSVHTTAEAMLGVAPRGLASIRALDCGQGLSDNSPPRLTTSNSKLSIIINKVSKQLHYNLSITEQPLKVLYYCSTYVQILNHCCVQG